MKRIFASRRTRWAAIVIIIVLPSVLVAYGVFEKNRPPIRYGVEYTIADYLLMNSDILLGLLFLLISAIPFFLVFDRRKPQARELVPVAVMAAIAVVGRAVFAIVPLPNFKPCSAVIMITAVVFGPETGFLTGALTAFVSNFLFGQGPWTPWQMFCWGLIGFLTGLMKNAGLFSTVGHVVKQPRPRFTSPKWDKICPPGTNRGDLLLFVRQTTEWAPMGLCLWGLATGFLYGWIMNLFFIFGYIDPITWQTVTAAYVSSFFFDLSHGLCTFLVLWALASPWSRKLERVKEKFGLVAERGNYVMPPAATMGRKEADDGSTSEYRAGADYCSTGCEERVCRG